MHIRAFASVLALAFGASVAKDEATAASASEPPDIGAPCHRVEWTKGLFNGSELISSSSTGGVSGGAAAVGLHAVLSGRPNRRVPSFVPHGDPLVSGTVVLTFHPNLGTMSVLSNGVLEGALVATYATQEGEEQVVGTSRGTRTRN